MGTAQAKFEFQIGFFDSFQIIFLRFADNHANEKCFLSVKSRETFSTT